MTSIEERALLVDRLNAAGYGMYAQAVAVEHVPDVLAFYADELAADAGDISQGVYQFARRLVSDREAGVFATRFVGKNAASCLV